MKRVSELSPRYSVRCGFTLVELLVVLLIVSIIAAVTLPVVIPAISHRQVGEAARIIQGGLVAARDASLRTNTPHGIRFLPDPTYDGQAPDSTTGNNSTYLSSTKILASNRFIPIEQPPGYSEGRVFLDNKKSEGTFKNLPQFADTTNRWGYFVNYPPLGDYIPGAGAGGANAEKLYRDGRVLVIVQSVYRYPPGSTGPPPLEAPTSWYWNVRAGDKIQINNVGPYFTVVGPMSVDTAEKFINVDPNTTTLQLYNSVTNSSYSPEYLFVVNGEDDDGDGYVDNGWDGVDNNGDGNVDDYFEWSEYEQWPAAYVSNKPSNPDFDNISGGMYYGIPYTIVRRPVPSPGARETVLPGSVVVDLTTWDRAIFNPERSRLPVDRLSGVVDVMVDSGGRMIPTTRYSSPSSFGMLDSFYHIWVAERSDLSEPLTNSSGVPQHLLATPNNTFYLPMPLGRDVGVSGPNYYDQLVQSNPTLPYLKGQVRILSLSTRTGNMITTDSPTFDVLNVNQPFRAAQLGLQGDTP